ncbi:MAG TPA: SpoIIE family protein phosphatase [Opitutales bacterium]|nr:SpoIIE family protein phosphatase [Opitutales bacterium]
MWSPNKSLVWRLSILILGGAGLVLAAVLFSSQISQSRLLVEQQRAQGEAVAMASVNRINEMLGRAQTLTESAAISLSSTEIGGKDLAPWLESLLNANPDLSCIEVAYSREGDNARQGLTRVSRADGIVSVDLFVNVALEHMQDWFYLPKYLRKPVWVEPFYDPILKTTAVTYSVPVFAPDGTLRAVVACELSLQGIRDMLDSLDLGESGMAILISAQGVYISHPVREYEMSQTMWSVAESLGSVGRPLPELEALARTLLSGKTGMTQYRRSSDDVPSYIFHRPVPLTGWAFSVTIPEAQILAPLRRQNMVNLCIGLCGGFLLLCASVALAYSLTKPLHLLAKAAGRLALGDFDAPLPKVRRGDEIGRLTASFSQMREDLRGYIDELTTTTVAKEKIASELAIAHQIQLGIVPKLFPPFPDRRDVDLFAALEPAREVGGDLYDFALLDEDHLYVAIGDVSGKGVPASLLMAVGKTLLKSTIHAVRDPARTLAMVNDELAAGNDTCMFITAFCGILNLSSGHFTYANAGHNPPLLIPQSGPAKFMRSKPGPALGAMTNVRYRNMDELLSGRELLVLYTDGVTEAMNDASEMFGEDRLLAIASAVRNGVAEKVVGEIVSAVRTHAAGAEQSDDITLLAVRSSVNARKPVVTEPSREPDSTLCLEGTREKLDALVAWLEGAAGELSIPDSETMALNLALEEWFVNVVSYAYTDSARHEVTFRLWKEGLRIVVAVEDDGQPFDPTAQATPDTSAGIGERSIGGLGIHFIRKTMNSMGYRRANGRNIVVIEKIISEG